MFLSNANRDVDACFYLLLVLLSGLHKKTREKGCRSLHWLPMCIGIDLKALLLAFKCLNILGPSFLYDLPFDRS